MRDITSDHIRAVVQSLDQKIHDPDVQFGWKTASKTWGAVTKLFKDAAHSKNPELRILRVNPCSGVEGPDRGVDKVAQWLYPNEFVALVGCEDVPLRWRRIYAVTTYLHLRLSEARALERDDLDLVVGGARLASIVRRTSAARSCASTPRRAASATSGSRRTVPAAQPDGARSERSGAGVLRRRAQAPPAAR